MSVNVVLSQHAEGSAPQHGANFDRSRDAPSTPERAFHDRAHVNSWIRF